MFVVERPVVEGFTLDPEGSPDLDDAIRVVKHPHGWTIYVHIADVAEHIRQDSKWDIDARRRAFSLYRLGGTRHMLPKFLAEEDLSLLPGKLRDTVTFTILLANDLSATEVFPTRKAFAIPPAKVFAERSSFRCS